MATRDVDKFFRDRLWTLIEARPGFTTTAVKPNNRLKLSDVAFDALMATRLAGNDFPFVGIVTRAGGMTVPLRTIGPALVPIPIKCEPEITLACASQREIDTGMACEIEAALLLNPDLGLPTFVKSMTYRRADVPKGTKHVIRWTVSIDSEFWPAELTV